MNWIFGALIIFALLSMFFVLVNFKRHRISKRVFLFTTGMEAVVVIVASQLLFTTFS